MKKLILFAVTILGIFSFIAATYLTSQNQNLLNQSTSHATLSPEAITSLEARGFEVAGQYFPVRSPRMLDSTNLPETAQFKMSLDVRKAKNLQITWLGAPTIQKMAASQNDAVLVEDFEGDFPGTNWQLSGDPTWGRSTYTKHGGQSSVFCARGGTAGVTPPANYPNNMNAMMVFGPFDLSNASLAFVRFWYWLETEINKDWFSYMASIDGVNFGGIGVSGSTGWEQTSLNLADVPDLGSLIGKPSVWIAFGFTSDSTGAKRGAFVDDVEVQKAAVGTGISGYLKGSLSPVGNPYIAFDHIGVAQGDSLEILPGTEIRFYPAIEFVVNGLLDAHGKETDSLIFCSNSTNPKPSDWLGIGFYSSSKSCTLSYSKIEFSGINIPYTGFAGIFCLYVDGGGPTILNNYISNNPKYGIFLHSCGGSRIENNKIKNNYNGLRLYSCSQIVVKNNIIENNQQLGIQVIMTSADIRLNLITQNETGIAISGNAFYGESYIQLVDNVIIKNIKDGISFGTGPRYFVSTRNIISKNGGSGMGMSWDVGGWYMRIYNNVLSENKRGISFAGDQSSTIINNIIYGNNEYGIYLNGEKIPSHNCFYNNGTNFLNFIDDSLGIVVKTNSNGDSCDTYYNIFKDPEFTNIIEGKYYLKFTSPCINAGNPCVTFNDYDSTKNDIGAFGGTAIYGGFSKYQLDFGEVVLDKKVDKAFTLLNHRENSFTIESAELSGSEYFKLNTSFPLKIPNELIETKWISINFQPRTHGEFYSILRLNSSGFYGQNFVEMELVGKTLPGTDIHGGPVYGIWKKSNSPYIVTDHISVEKNDTLIIEPGVEIYFDGPGKYGWPALSVYGYLNAAGTKNDSIKFSILNEDKEWQGISFIGGSGGKSLISYCIIEKATFDNISAGGIRILNNNIENKHDVTIKNSTIRYCYGRSGGAISIGEGVVKILNNHIHNNYCAYGYNDDDKGCITIYKSDAQIQHNLIEDNYHRAILIQNSNPILMNNEIRNNRGDAILCNSGNPTIIANKIMNNKGRAIASYSTNWNWGDSKILIKNCIINNNEYLTGSALKFGGTSYWGAKTLILENCILYNNKSVKGGIIDSRNDIPTGTIDTLIIKNSIFWSRNDTLQNVIFDLDTEDSFIVVYSNLKGYPGEGNIDAVPLFLSPENENFHLQPNSPCIDAGDPDPNYNDPKDPANPGYALYPAMGTIRNDMGAYGGPGAAATTINHPPAIFRLLEPTDGDTIQTSSPTFKWHSAIDLDPGDFVHYTLLCDSSRSFIKPITVIGIPDTSFTFADSLNNNTRYFWTVLAVDRDSFTTASTDTFSFLVRNRPTGVAGSEGSELPTEFALSQNYPNPFNAQTTIKYQLPTAQEVKLAIYNLRGQRVATLVDRKEAAGYYSINWDGRDEFGHHVASGIYFYRLEMEAFVKVRKLVLLR